MLPDRLSGVVLGDRFTLEARVGEGGMAAIYRARDQLTGSVVAVKLLHADTKSSYIQDHFVREAEILASLDHPHIVSYIAHGRTQDGATYLAVEWLEGEDLGHRLTRGPLRLSETLQLATILADALSMTHGRGVVHRDLKPNNLFLRQRKIEQLTLLDFGIARQLATAARAMTQTGVVVGTPEYMAPEQVRGERAVGAAADIFAVGCLLYECLTGKPPFFGEQVVSVLAKILFEEPPDIRLIRPGLPAQVVELLASMLVKDAAARLPDGAALAAALAKLPRFEDDDFSLVAIHALPTAQPGALEAVRPSGLRGEVQELLGVVLASAAGAMRKDAETAQVATQEFLADRQRDLLKRLRALGAHAEFLLDGSLVAVLQPSGSATDQATQAAQAALLVHEGWPAAQVAVTMGLGTRPGQMTTSAPAPMPMPMPMGEVLDRAARLLVADTLVGSGSEPTGSSGAIVLDEVTAGLISGRFQVTKRSSGSFLLVGPRAALDEQRPLLGKPTPCVGRERELGQLLSALNTTIDEPMAQAVIVLAPAGSGKSRLRHEFLRRIDARGQDVLVLIGRGASLSRGSAFGMLGQALRALCGVHEGDSAEERWRRFAERIGENLPAERAPVVIPLLAAISQVTPGAGVPGPLRVGLPGLQDPNLFYEEFARAFVEFLTAECAARPVLLILEDLHWGDASTVRLVDTALRELAEQPLLVVALGRPEMQEQFPDLWSKRSCQHIPLWGLGKRACERLIREVLGPNVTPELESRIIAQAGGNALFLEELIRAVAEGKTEGAPDTVVAMLQARLGRLQPRARTLLCAASIFGSVFFRGGVAALLGSVPLAGVDTNLAQLVELELVNQSASSRLANEVEYGFRHDLIRDAAYDLLTKEDRVLGHYLAAQYLEQAGEREAVTLAEHYRRGDSPEQATKWYQRSAEQALDANELGTAQRRAQSAIDAGANGEERGQLYGLQATAAYWLRNDKETRRCAEQALLYLTPGKKDWYFSAAHFLVSCGRLKDWDVVSAQLAIVMSTAPEPAAISALGLCLARTGYMFMMQGRVAQMQQIADELARFATELLEAEPSALAQVDHFRSAYALMNGDIISGVQYMEKTIQSFERAQDQRNALMERNTLACNLVEIGQHERAEQVTRLNLRECERLKIPAPRSMTLVILGYSLTFFADKQEEARKILNEALERSRASQNRLHQSWALTALARLSYTEGRFAEVETYALPALEIMRADATTFQTWPLGWLARGYVRQGRLEEGRAFAEQANASLKALGSFTMAPMVPPLARAEVLLALGERDAARQAIASAKRRVLRLADRLTDPSWRAWFVGHSENAATLALPDEPPA